MNKIKVAVLHEAHSNPAGMMMFLAKLTQRGHNISDMKDLLALYSQCVDQPQNVSNLVNLPHGTIKRFTPITIAIVGASRRFLAQARTNQVGITYVSASLQYSDYSGKADFVVPYELLNNQALKDKYMDSCNYAMETYENLIANGASNDTAGYVVPQGLRNILIMQANNESWLNFIRLRACKRNTDETRFVAMKLWELLLETTDGHQLFNYAGPDCLYGKCREGKMTCRNPIYSSDPTAIIKEDWPCL
jgi:thymidylate synthase (FAD)